MRQCSQQHAQSIVGVAIEETVCSSLLPFICEVVFSLGFKV